MVYSSSSDNSGIVEDARWMVGANSTSYPIEDLTRNANRWLDRAVSIIVPASGTWQFDDNNYTDYPIATAALVSGQTDYVMDVSFLRVERVEVKDESDNWVRLKQFDRTEVGQAISDFMDADGSPQYYDVSANSVKLYPAPNYSQASSIKVFFQRKGSYFDTTDTTKTPGFAEIFHRYISLGAAMDFSKKFRNANAQDIQRDINVMESDMQNFYSRRNRDGKHRMTPVYKTSK